MIPSLASEDERAAESVEAPLLGGLSLKDCLRCQKRLGTLGFSTGFNTMDTLETGVDIFLIMIYPGA